MTAVPPSQGNRVEPRRVPLETHIIGFRKPVSPFVEDSARHHPKTDKPPRHCLAAIRPGSRRLLLRPLSHPTAFESPAHHARAPKCDFGNDWISQVRHGLCSTRHVGSGLPHGQITARPPLPRRRSFRPALGPVDFGGSNTEASPYPSMIGLFPVRHRPESDSLARAFAPRIMVELFAAGRLTPTPASVESRSCVSPRQELPTPARLSEHERCYPLVARNPRDRISDWFASPALNHSGLGVTTSEVFPCRPHSHSKKNRYRIEDRDYSAGFPTGLRRSASVEPDEHVSVHPALRA